MCGIAPRVRVSVNVKKPLLQSFPEFDKGQEGNVPELLERGRQRCEGRGRFKQQRVNIKKVMFPNLSEVRVDRGLQMEPVDDSQWSNSNGGELQRLPLPTDWLSTCFPFNPPFWIERL